MEPPSSSISTPSTNKKRFTGCSDKWINLPDLKDCIGRKDDFTAICKICNSEIAIQYEGRRALTVHVNSAKHKKMVTARKTFQIDNFIMKKDTKEEISVVNSEIGLVYHNVKHGLSYNSLECLAKAIKLLQIIKLQQK
ncbi:hypothetical protein HHI36_012996 [Cryptolaemus montrouzieri]|uniref:Uncharacterized protein n=1 Tax=Cryptolaemus montrouzieri TaxID=559131 RepID=A0ABD2NG17_9CUCU